MNGTNSRDEWRKSPIKYQISPVNDVDEKKYAVPFILVKGVLFKEERPHTVPKPNLKSKNSDNESLTL